MGWVVDSGGRWEAPVAASDGTAHGDRCVGGRFSRNPHAPAGSRRVSASCLIEHRTHPATGRSLGGATGCPPSLIPVFYRPGLPAGGSNRDPTVPPVIGLFGTARSPDPSTDISSPKTSGLAGAMPRRSDSQGQAIPISGTRPTCPPPPPARHRQSHSRGPPSSASTVQSYPFGGPDRRRWAPCWAQTTIFDSSDSSP
jgi:hypothetical protein